MRFDRYIGLPWLDRGRTPAGVDCWGLVRLVYAGELGIDLPNRADDYSNAGDRHAILPLVEEARPDWTRISGGAGARFDLVLIRQAPWHVGVIVGRGLMLHIPEGGTSCIEPYTTGRWGNRVEGTYRHISIIGRAA
jgi:cell wall-associated NlpC family hydrolase